MRRSLLFAVLVLAASCATAPPPELVDARAAYQHASVGPAASLAPRDLTRAREALTRAEQAYVDSPRSMEVRDLGYAAGREALAADAAAGAESARRDKAAAEATIAAATAQNRERAITAEERARQDALARAQAEREGQASAADARAALERADTESAGRTAAEQGRLEAEARAQSGQERATAEEQARGRAEAEAQRERAARLQAEREAAAAVHRLEQAGSVREEARGRVITLSGSVLFASGTASLLPTARRRLDDVATALASERDARYVVAGYTDARGSEGSNLKLSAARAQAVRSYLVEHGVPEVRIAAVGKGAEDPIASNATAEGRANNRRVEIIVNRREAKR